MSRCRRTAGALLLCWGLVACQAITHDYAGSRSLTPGTKLLHPSQSVGQISGSKKALFTLFGLIRLNNGSGAELVEDLAEEKIGEDFDGITRIRIRERTNWIDVLVNLALLPVFSMRTVEVEGDVHRHVSSGGGAR